MAEQNIVLAQIVVVFHVDPILGAINGCDRNEFRAKIRTVEKNMRKKILNVLRLKRTIQFFEMSTNYDIDCFIDTLRITDPIAYGCDLFLQFFDTPKISFGFIPKNTKVWTLQKTCGLISQLPKSIVDDQVPISIVANKGKQEFVSRFDLTEQFKAAPHVHTAIITNVEGSLKASTGKTVAIFSGKFCISADFLSYQLTKFSTKRYNRPLMKRLNPSQLYDFEYSHLTSQKRLQLISTTQGKTTEKNALDESLSELFDPNKAVPCDFESEDEDFTQEEIKKAENDVHKKVDQNSQRTLPPKQNEPINQQTKRDKIESKNYDLAENKMNSQEMKNGIQSPDLSKETHVSSNKDESKVVNDNLNTKDNTNFQGNLFSNNPKHISIAAKKVNLSPNNPDFGQNIINIASSLEKKTDKEHSNKVLTQENKDIKNKVSQDIILNDITPNEENSNETIEQIKLDSSSLSNGPEFPISEDNYSQDYDLFIKPELKTHTAEQSLDKKNPQRDLSENDKSPIQNNEISEKSKDEKSLEISNSVEEQTKAKFVLSDSTNKQEVVSKLENKTDEDFTSQQMKETTGSNVNQDIDFPELQVEKTSENSKPIQLKLNLHLRPAQSNLKEESKKVENPNENKEIPDSFKSADEPVKSLDESINDSIHPINESEINKKNSQVDESTNEISKQISEPSKPTDEPIHLENETNKQADEHSKPADEPTQLDNETNKQANEKDEGIIESDVIEIDIDENEKSDDEKKEDNKEEDSDVIVDGDDDFIDF